MRAGGDALMAREAGTGEGRRDAGRRAGRCWEGGVREMRNQGDSRDSSQAEGEGSARWGDGDSAMLVLGCCAGY